MNEKQSKQPNRKNNKKDKGNKVKETYPSIQIIVSRNTTSYILVTSAFSSSGVS